MTSSSVLVCNTSFPLSAAVHSSTFTWLITFRVWRGEFFGHQNISWTISLLWTLNPIFFVVTALSKHYKWPQFAPGSVHSYCFGWIPCTGNVENHIFYNVSGLKHLILPSWFTSLQRKS
jgi:hypothetical protein